ncbi:YggS family pyridoxal phosphate-dependent enzyme [Halonatronum saccharophilum]|uniref:YggS family pyridoxal phosphate-dependent enzyme n=1 Tax=Halonatronum saccharophilum TaxID=150060 RepID=UPI000489DA43|nr:YggS family pyridoxal phosphate-dependent enzyme [Halonatronum saccharophilum]
MEEVRKRLLQVQGRIDKALLKSGRSKSEVKLISVSKNHSLDKMEVVLEEGIIDFGESRVQELDDKYQSFSKEVNWHMIGHLQRNKVKYLARIPSCKLIHSVDSIRLAKEINKRANNEERVMNILVQVNTAQDDNKYGISYKEGVDFVKKVSALDNVKVKGLMTIAPYSSDPENVRPYFRKLKELSLEIKKEGIEGVEMKELSMGMSNDLEVAIEEGATLLRVGSGIFGERDYN